MKNHQKEPSVIRIGVIGCGHWGPNHIRVFHQLPGSRVTICADLDRKRLDAVNALFPQIETTTRYEEILKDPRIDAVCISVPTDMHFQISREALEQGKHVFCEKPLTLVPEQCAALSELADRAGKILMVGHVFVFNSGIMRLKNYIDSGELGRIYYAHSERTNLGPFRYDVNALWDLAPHDISIFNYLFEDMPLSVSARGAKYLGSAQEDLVFASLVYPEDVLVNVHVSWLDPRKVRQITIVGDKKMVVWDDLDNNGPIRLYDKHVEKTSKYYETYGEFQMLSKEGSITIPHIPAQEPLKAQAQYFIDALASGRRPERADAKKAYDVVKTLCAIQASVEEGGQPVKLR